MEQRLASGDYRGVIATLDQLLRVHPEYSADFFPVLQQALVIPGTQDAFADLKSWYRLEDVIPLVEFLVVSRPSGGGERTPGPPGVRARWVRGIEHPASSTDIRRRVAEGEPLDGLVPASVADYIREHKLYR